MEKIETRSTLLGLTIRFVKDYRKNSFALIFSLLLSITLIFSILTLLHTNYRVIAKQNLFIYTAMKLTAWMLNKYICSSKTLKSST